MRKHLIGLISLIIIIIIAWGIYSGFSFLPVKAYKEIVMQDRQLAESIKLVENLNNNTLNAQKLELIKAVEEYNKTKEEYDNKIETMKGNKKIQIEVYDLDFLWARIGNYATECDLNLELAVQNTSMMAQPEYKQYNLEFTVDGMYTDVVRFIYKIEGDAEVAAKISSFVMEPSAIIDLTETVKKPNETETTRKVVQGLKAKFTIKNIPLNHKNISGFNSGYPMDHGMMEEGMRPEMQPQETSGAEKQEKNKQDAKKTEEKDIIDRVQSGEEVSDRDMLVKRNEANR